MIIRRIINRVISIASIILLALIFATGCTMAAQETAPKALQNMSINYSEIKPKTDFDREADKALHHDQETARIHNERGIAYSEKGQFDLAIAEFNKALQNNPSESGIYNNRGIALSKKGQYGPAISDFTKALEMDSNDASAYYNRGIAYAFTSRLDLAFADLNKSLELIPVNPSAYDLRGSIHAILACADWGQACKAGNCEKLKEAMRIGFCIQSSEQRALTQ
jgi:lipoprotein NlpI